MKGAGNFRKLNEEFFDKVKHGCPPISRLRKQVCSSIEEVLIEHLLCVAKSESRTLIFNDHFTSSLLSSLFP